jgi:hypothetical protein
VWSGFSSFIEICFNKDAVVSEIDLDTLPTIKGSFYTFTPTYSIEKK